MFEILIGVVLSLGVTLGVGASTFALTFFINGMRDGVLDSSERRFLHIVFVVLRIGMVLIGTALILSLFSSIPFQGALWFLLAVILLNAVLMDKKAMPMSIGPIIAGGSWYALFFVTSTPLGGMTVLPKVSAYIVFLLVFFVTYRLIVRLVTLPPLAGMIEVDTDDRTRASYATDASAFRITPHAVYYPKNSQDIVALTKQCAELHHKDACTSLTVRAGGTCMSGGPLNDGWIVDMTKYMKGIIINPKEKTATVEMGAYFRDLEDEALKHGLMFAPYPSSRRICGIGGMLGNNASGEKSLRNGATSDNVLELEVVLADGTIERIAPKQVKELTTERERTLYELYTAHGDAMRNASGDVPKSASGYRFHKIVDGDSFNAVPLFVGAQGTLGIITKAVLKLTPIPKYTELIFIGAHSLKDIPATIDTIFEHNPEGLETFDIHTFEKAREHLSESAARVEPYISPDAHLFILAQFSERTKKATQTQAQACIAALAEKGFHAVHVTNKEDADALWNVRRNSFLLMRDHNELGQRAVPCIEDVIVPRHELGTFIAELDAILKRRGISYGFHGHIGEGSLRIIPVFDFTRSGVTENIVELMREVFALVKRLHGNMSADHSDGIIRTPFLREFYGEELYTAFEDIKRLYDPANIMNPKKKVGGTLAFMDESLNREA